MLVLADISDSVQQGADEIGNWVPNLIGALVILIVGYFVAKLIGRLVHRVLARAGTDRVLTEGQGGSWVQKVTDSPSRLLGKIAYWVVFLGAISLAVSVLGIESLENFVAAIYSYLPNVLAALAIFVVASAIAAGVAKLATRLMGDTSLGKIIATVAPLLVMTIATFMILDQLQIASTIVTITYAGLIGGIALGAALAFGLGGRDVAGRMLEGAYAAGQANKDQFRRDLDTGMSRARDEASRLRDEHAPERADVAGYDDRAAPTPPRTTGETP